MAADKTTAEDDLAFIRRLTSPDQGPAWRRSFGRMYALWGLAFAIPLFAEWARWMGWIILPRDFWLWAAAIVTVLLTVASIYYSRKDGPTVGVQSRALNAVFGGAGLANIVMLAALVAVSVQLTDGRIMMLHASIVFAFQGAAWFVVWALRKQFWTGVIAAGWFVTAVALGFTLATPYFILIAALGLVFLMAVPGLAMMRGPKAD
jgi:hypothetical protein